MSDQTLNDKLAEIRQDWEMQSHTMTLADLQRESIAAATADLREQNEQLRRQLDAANDESMSCNNIMVQAEAERDKLRQELAESEASRERLRTTLQEIWDEDEMGCIVDDTTEECVKCGAERLLGTTLTMVYDVGCVQGWISKALAETESPSTALDRYVSEKLDAQRAELEACQKACAAMRQQLQAVLDEFPNRDDVPEMEREAYDQVKAALSTNAGSDFIPLADLREKLRGLEKVLEFYELEGDKKDVIAPALKALTILRSIKKGQL